MKSHLVVISWWSNCIGLTCLHNLVRHTSNRNIYYVQVGKSPAQKERFRKHQPASVIELPYPDHLSAEHSKVIECIAFKLLCDHEGLWFFDHDTFVVEDLDPWLVVMDLEFERSPCCLSYVQSSLSPSITNPLFWASPMRFPKGLPSFDPVPYRKSKASQRPDLFRAKSETIMPIKDTLMVTAKLLSEKNLTCGFSLKSFPKHKHLGGLYMFAGEIPPESLFDWMESRVKEFSSFYKTCPREWIEMEDPTLIERIKEFQRVVSRKELKGLRCDRLKRQGRYD